MARLAQLRFVIKELELTEDNISSLGQIADRVAQQSALRVYGEGVEVDVVLEEGSTLAKIGVIGALALGSYHAVASYPDFLNGVATISMQAQDFSHEFIGTFLKQSKASKDQITKLKVTSPTPEKIEKLAKTLHDLDHETPRRQSTNLRGELAKARSRLRSITRDLSESEAEHLNTLLKFKNLPPPERWPTITKEEKSYGSGLGRSSPPAARTDKLERPRLRYHNRFRVKKGP